MYLAAKELGVTISDLTDDTYYRQDEDFISRIGVIGQNVCPFWLVFLCGGGRSSCSSCMGGELEVGQNVCPEWPVRPCGTTVE